MTVKERLKLRERTHLEIAISAAIAAGLAKTAQQARREMERIIEENPAALKEKWFYERHGGVKGWRYFLRSYGYEEATVVRKITHLESQME